MKSKRSLIAILLAVGLCLVPGVGHGFVIPYEDPQKREIQILEARLNYIMYNPIGFSGVDYWYDERGGAVKGKGLPEGIDTSGKIIIEVIDNRDRYVRLSGTALLDGFKKELITVWSYIQNRIATDMDIDVVARFWSKEMIPLAYFYQGEYHLWPTQQQRVSDSSKHPKRSYSGLGGGHWIAEKIERGRQIKLEDGSLWKISVRHRLRTMLWETSQQITVAENDDLLYPYRLINQNTGDTVEAELVSE